MVSSGLKLEPENAATKKALEDSIAGRANAAGRPSGGGMGGGGGAGDIILPCFRRDQPKHSLPATSGGHSGLKNRIFLAELRVGTDI